VILEAPVSEDAKGTALDRTQMGRLQTDKLTLEEGYKIFENFYVRMVVDSAPKFGTVLRAIATTDKPSMFHCTGGRDRTGITAALLLHILGVPDQTIANDFVLSTKYLNENPAPMNIPGIQPGTEKARFFAQVIELQPRYIAAIFKGIDEKYGSFDRYRREALRLSDADVALLKSRLLQ
jgi:protein-tyrosine phosphatase